MIASIDDRAAQQSATPSVSVGLPVYNGQHYLPAAIDAFLAQTYRDFELIITDNASTDRTEEICRAYAARDARVRYVRNERNLGAAMNYRRAFELARGKYFRWAASDDLPGADMIECCVRILEEDASVVVAYPRTMLIDADGRQIREYDDNLDLRSTDPVVRFKQYFERVGMCNPVYGLIRADALRRTRLLGSFIASDNPLLAELTLYGRFYEVPRPLFFRRIHAEAYSSQTDRRRLVAFYFPNARHSLVFTAWRHFGENLRAIGRSPVSLTDKVRLWVHMLRMANWGRAHLFSELTGAVRHVARAAAAGLTPHHRP